jgi:hypothetical protein
MMGVCSDLVLLVIIQVIAFAELPFVKLVSFAPKAHAQVPIQVQ